MGVLGCLVWRICLISRALTRAGLNYHCGCAVSGWHGGGCRCSWLDGCDGGGCGGGCDGDGCDGGVCGCPGPDHGRPDAPGWPYSCSGNEGQISGHLAQAQTRPRLGQNEETGPG